MERQGGFADATLLVEEGHDHDRTSPFTGGSFMQLSPNVDNAGSVRQIPKESELDKLRRSKSRRIA
ncbi:hypothetical protein GCM10010909_33570 [Acidocella aquatica]|uniref:Uncharacterized protein n=1 Tax=Acidocella aquatica TaxID=1922313 RepID=A0ABQ6AF61_9PROT|nr:hypothetical protein GCM10010909_33570 [Acidocella aquatica]